MDGGSTGVVPAVNTAEVRGSSATSPAEALNGVKALDMEASREKAADHTYSSSPCSFSDLDRDLLCPICMQIIKDAFLTACGHSFCYMCIITHLHNKSDCPCCAHHLTVNQLFPNFLLDKVRTPDGVIGKTGWAFPSLLQAFDFLLKKASAHQTAKAASPIEQFRHALEQGCEVSIKELDSLLSLLTEKKQKMEQEEAERNMQILLDFLNCLKKQKVDELNEVQSDLQYIKEDVIAVERHRMDLSQARDRFMMKMRMLDDPTFTKSRSLSIDKHNNSSISVPRREQVGMHAINLHGKRADGKAEVNNFGHQRRDAFGGLEPHHVNQSGLAVARKKRILSQFNDLQECYLQKRRLLINQPVNSGDRSNNDVMHREGYSLGLSDFQSVLTAYTQYSRLRVIAELRHGDLFHSANIVSSIEFDRDNELFATAGVSRRIKVFDFSLVLNDPPEVHSPVVEMSTRSKLSCLSWNKYTKNHIASSDYEGIVTVWDITTRQSVMEYEEHEKRAWSVDFSRTEPSMLVSGSDDCKVKVWCTKQEASVLDIDMKANICCVKYNPESSVYVAVGSADHHIHYYDLRNISQPLHVFNGHRKTVSYVKFLSSNELASASTDSTLRLWDVKENLSLRTYKGHTNEKNFVGLTVNSDYIACGSETNEIYVYHKAITKPVTWHRFGSPDMDEADEEVGSYFISAVCWKSDSPTILAANSQGTIKVLVLGS
ncbi:WD40 repeat [Dillenia turbinata]|uniref:WD40 repeat n=1 Tax=Dillenia turbinata TaxID=194707 RepID=A0AAN8URL9_9MAGN